jgi:hypothetical protein
VFILFRLIKTLVFAALLLAIVGVIAFVLGRPFVERLAARSIEDRIGTPVSVSIATSLSPGIVRGDLGDVTVRADKFDRNGLRLAGARAVYHGTSVKVGDLISGNVKIHYASVDFQGSLTAGALAAYLRPLLIQRGLPAKALRVTITQGRATLAMGSAHAAVTAKILGVSSIRLMPISGSATITRALASPIQLGPLPDGVHLTGIELRAGRASLTGHGDGGKIRA